MKLGTFRKGVGVVAASFFTVTAMAQPGGQAVVQPAQSDGPALNIPQNVTFLGSPANPNVARATAIVNDEIITRTDVEQRLFLLLADQTARLPEEEMERARAQILRQLIDETLQIQNAREREIEIERAIIDREFARMAQQTGHTGSSFGSYLSTIGSSERSLKRQILGQASWQRIQQRLPQPSVGDGEVANMLARLNASRGAPEYRVAEIYMSATPENSQQVRERLGQIIEQIRGGASFPAYARQYSEASTGAIGGDLGWVKSELLPPELGAIVQQMPVGAISDPIQVQGGFSTIVLTDSRQVLTANPRDAVLSLMQMSIAMPANTPEATARQRAAQLATATQSMGGCGRAAEAATAAGADLVANDAVRVRDLPPQLQQTLLGLNIGQATQPFGTNERISVLVLCGRDDAQVAPAPTIASITEGVEDERRARQAQRYLRDLRRDAVVEYR